MCNRLLQADLPNNMQRPRGSGARMSSSVFRVWKQRNVQKFPWFVANYQRISSRIWYWPILVGGDWNMTGWLFHINWEVNNHPNWRVLIFFRGVGLNHQEIPMVSFCPWLHWSWGSHGPMIVGRPWTDWGKHYVSWINLLFQWPCSIAT